MVYLYLMWLPLQLLLYFSVNPLSYLLCIFTDYSTFIFPPSLPFVVVAQSLSSVHLFVTPRTAARQASLSFTISWSLLKLMYIQSMMPTNHLILCRPLLLPSIFTSIRVFSNESGLHIRWPKYWSFSFSISAFNEYSGLISFRIDWFDLLESKGLSSLLQHHSSKHQFSNNHPSLWSNSSHPFMTTGKTIALLAKSLFFNMLSRFVIAFLLRSKRLSRLQSWNTVLVIYI